MVVLTTILMPFQQLSYGQILPDVKFKFYGDESGLSNTSISGIQKDKYGFLWIATGDGLNRFDGKNFKVFKNIEGDSTSLINDFNQFLAVDQEGELWISYHGKGVSKFDNECQCFRNNYDISFQNTKLYNYGTSILRIERDSTLWIGGNLNGLNLLNLKTQSIKHWDLPDLDARYKGLEKDAVNSVYQIHTYDGNLFWLATGAGLYTFDKSKEIFKHISASLSKHNKYRYDFFTSLVPESMDGLWLGSNGGSLFFYDFVDGKFQSFQSTHFVENKAIDYAIYSIQRKSEHELWVIIASRGLGVFNTQTKEFYFPNDDPAHVHLFQMNSIYMVHPLPDGHIFGAAPGGLVQLTPHARVFNFKELKLKNSQYSNQFHFSKIVKKGTQLFFGTLFGNGFNVLDTRTGILDNYPIDYHESAGEKFMKVQDVVVDGSQRIWVVGNYCIYKFDATRKKMEPLKNLFLEPEADSGYVVTRIIEDIDGVLWVLTNKGSLHVLDPQKQKLSRRLNSINNDYDLPTKIVNMVISPTGKIWIGTKSDVYFFQREKMKAILVKNEVYQEKIKNGFYVMTTDTTGNLWVSLPSIGLLYINYSHGNFIVKTLDKAQGLPSSNVYHICFDYRNILWFSTITGIYTYNPATHNFTAYGSKDGVDPSYLSTRFFLNTDSSLFLAVPGRYSQVNFQAIHRQTSNPSLYIYKFYIQNREQVVPYAYPLSFRLKSNENFFSFEFSCIDFENQNNHRYAYMLDGWDPEWIHCGARNYARYGNVDGGHYTFKVKIDNGSGEWGPVLATPIFIDSPFYKKVWFLILIIVFFAGLIFLLYRIRIQQVETTERIKTEFNRQLTESRMEALRAQMNPHFIFNCLNSINRYIVKSDIKTSSLYLTRFAKLMRLILDNSEHKKVVLSNELEALKLYIEMEALRFDHRFSYEILVEPNLDADHFEIPPLIIQPYVENAIWHGLLPKESGGHISIHVKLFDEHVVFEIEDNGIGRNKSSEFKSLNSPTRKSMGMKLTEERLKLASDNISKAGSQEIIDKYDKAGNPIGTKVILNIPC